MSAPFRIVALPAETFAPLFDRTDEELRAIGARRVVVDERPGFPCRVSLEDAYPGETVLLTPYAHHDVASPYRGLGPVYVRRGVPSANLAPGEIPEMLRRRLLSLRAYDADGELQYSEVVEGTELDAAIRRQFELPGVEYLHVHNAKPGCFNCRVERA